MSKYNYDRQKYQDDGQHQSHHGRMPFNEPNAPRIPKQTHGGYPVQHHPQQQTAPYPQHQSQAGQHPAPKRRANQKQSGASLPGEFPEMSPYFQSSCNPTVERKNGRTATKGKRRSGNDGNSGGPDIADRLTFVFFAAMIFLAVIGLIGGTP